MADRLSAQDCSFLYAESPVAHMHVGSLSVFEDGGFDEAALHRHILSRLDKVPRFRQKLHWLPYDLHRPVWVDDPHFDLRFHIRYTGLPRPRGMDEALRLTGRVMSLPLDRTRPLWEMWLFDLPENRLGLIQKTHHCMIDGLSGVDLATVLLDPTPDAPPAVIQPWRPEEPPDDLELVREAVLDAPLESLRGMLAGGGRREGGRRKPSGGLWQSLRDTSRGVVAFGRKALERAPDNPLNAPIGPHRRFAIARTGLDRVKALKNRAGCTVNDVVLAMVTGGLRTILRARGAALEGLRLKAMVPVSVRDPSQRMTYGNKVSMMTATLPVDEPDPSARLRFLSRSMTGLKKSKQAVGGDFWARLADFAPPTVLALAGRAIAMQRMFNLAITNVPGPQQPLWLLGGQLLETFPYVPLFGNVSYGVAVMSYHGALNFGVSGDWDVMPDLQVLADGIQGELAVLEAAVAEES